MSSIYDWPAPRSHHNIQVFLGFANFYWCFVVYFSWIVVAVHTVPPDQVRLIGSTGLDSRLILMERSVKKWVGVLRDSACGLL